MAERDSCVAVLTSGAALAISLAVYCLYRSKDEDDGIRVAPFGRFETATNLRCAKAPLKCLEMAKTSKSLIFGMRLPIPGNFVMVGDFRAQRQVLFDKTSDKAFDKITSTPSLFTRQTKDPV